MPHENIKLKSLTIAAAGLIGLLLADTVWAHHPAGTGGKLVFRLSSDIGSFNSIRTPVNNDTRNNPLAAMHDNLFDRDADTNELIPQAAVSAEPSDNYKRWRIKLRKGMKFSNGVEVTSQAYKAHFDRFLSSKPAGRFRRIMGPAMDRVEVVDKYTFDFHFRQASPGFKSILTMPIITWYVQEPGWVAKNQKKRSFGLTSIGQGPYMLKSWKPGDKITMVRNPNYWNPKAQHLDEIIYQIIPSRANAFNALKAGQIDVMLVPTTERDRAESSNTTVLDGVSNIAPRGIGFNSSVAPFNDIRVRRALIQAIDRKGVTMIGTRNETGVPTHMYPSDHPWFCKNTKMPWPEYSPEKAKKLLAEYGKPVKFELNIISIKTISLVAQSLQAQWKAIGVDASIKVGPRGPSYNRGITSGKYDIWWTNFGNNVDPSVVAINFNSKSKSNFYKVNDSAIDEALNKLRNAKGKAARLKASCNYQKLLVEQVRYYPFRNAVISVGFSNRIGGMQKPMSNGFKAHRAWIRKK
ncbi:MAG: ABC transporter substrate-binding protein [Rhodospirillaceae bacterium]|nr:ABC transporter substrate-binding protein [Rhodospirillaceae bacterium]